MIADNTTIVLTENIVVPQTITIAQEVSRLTIRSGDMGPAFTLSPAATLAGPVFRIGDAGA